MTYNVLRDMALLGEKDRHTLALCANASDHAEQHNNWPPDGGERGVKKEGIKVTETKKCSERHAALTAIHDIK